MNFNPHRCAINRVPVCKSEHCASMPASKGLKVQQSRFAALALETSSESEEERGGGEWETVKKASHKAGSAKQTQKKLGDGHEVESKPLSKNAKKRARKKRQQQAVSEVHSIVKQIVFLLNCI